VNVKAGVNGGCVHQVFKFLMIVAYPNDGGELRQHSYQKLGTTGIYDQWVRINTIHDADAKKAEIYINGVLKGTTPSASPGPGGWYHKYGIYNSSGTSPVVRWREVKFFKQGDGGPSAPDAGPGPAGDAGTAGELETAPAVDMAVARDVGSGNGGASGTGGAGGPGGAGTGGTGGAVAVGTGGARAGSGGGGPGASKMPVDARPSPPQEPEPGPETSGADPAGCAYSPGGAPGRGGLAGEILLMGVAVTALRLRRPGSLHRGMKKPWSE
jgi:hypothetical protein